MDCRICGLNYNDTFRTREMVLGLREEFTYGKCPSCKTIQINEIPHHLGDYYPNEYYSLHDLEQTQPHSKWKSVALIKRDLYHLGIKSSLIGSLFQRLKPASFDSMYMAYTYIYEQLKKRKRVSIHDAGCGNGFFLKYFHDLGFSGLSGSDPFLQKDLSYGSYQVSKKSLDQVEGVFDIIILNHVIEHVIDPLAYLKTVYDKLTDNGECLVSTPMSTSLGSEEYQSNWVGLEPPRHLHIFDADHFQQVAKNLGFDCYQVHYDAISWHFQASEAYSRNVALNEMNGKQLFSQQEQQHFAEKAKQANAKNKGDTVVYYLKKI